MNPKFSIIVPLYNKAPYVRKALESVFAQTYRDFELIIVDDGSTDNSVAICEDFLSRLSTLDSRLIRQSNSGVAAARNKGIADSHGDYLCFLDADDWWKSTYLEEMTHLIDDYPDAGIYATNYIYYKPGKTHVALNLPRGYINYPQAYSNSQTMPIWTGTTCISRSIFEEMGGFPVGVKLGEDFLLWAQIALHHKVAFCNRPLAYYNNDVPIRMRATRNLYPPHNHMLFFLEPLEKEIALLSDTSLQSEWKQLLDWLRVTGLRDYWMNNAYHTVAAVELAKVDWDKQPISVIRWYHTPIWLLRIHHSFMKIGSFCKQTILRLFH